MMGNEQDTGAQVRAAFDAYMRAYFTERNLPEIWAILADDLFGFGTGADEIALEPGQLKALFARDVADAPNPIAFRFHDLNVVALSENSGIVAAVLDISMEIEGQPLGIEGLRLSAVFQRRDGRWLLVHKHISTAATIHEEGEAYPLKELERRNQWLEEKVAEKTGELLAKNASLEKALAKVKQLSGLLPICASCKRIRDDGGYWQDVAEYVRQHSEAEFTHGICPECAQRLYPEYAAELSDEERQT